MRHILVLKDVLQNAKIGGGAIADLLTEAEALADGAIAIAVPNGTVLTTANHVATLAGVGQVSFWQGGPNVSDLRRRVNVLRTDDAFYTKEAYSAPVKEIKFIGFNGVTGSLNLPTLVAKDVAFIRLTRQSPIRDLTDDKWRFEYVVQEGDVEADVVTGLVDAINADTTCPVTASAVGTTGIQLDADNFRETWAIGLDGIVKNADKDENGADQSTAIEYGTGTYDDVKALIEQFAGNVGDSNRYLYPDLFFSKGNNAAEGVGYDLYTIKWENKRAATGKTTRYESDQELIIAVPNTPGTFVQAEFDTIMTAIFPAGSVLNNG